MNEFEFANMYLGEYKKKVRRSYRHCVRSAMAETAEIKIPLR